MRRGIQSIEIGISVLRVLARSSGPLHLREIAHAAGMPPSKAYRYLVSFMTTGMVKQDMDSSRYDLGPFSIELGLAALGRIDELDIATDALRRVSTEVGCDVHLTAWGDSGPTVLRWHQGRNDIAIRVREGALMPMITSATGRVWACYLPKPVTAPFIEAELDELQRKAGQRKTALRKNFEAHLAVVRRHRLARAPGAKRRGVDALSGPIFNQRGIRFAMTLLGSQGDVDFSYASPLAASFRRILEELSIQLGADSKSSKGKVVAIETGRRAAVDGRTAAARLTRD